MEDIPEQPEENESQDILVEESYVSLLMKVRPNRMKKVIPRFHGKRWKKKLKRMIMATMKN